MGILGLLKDLIYIKYLAEYMPCSRHVTNEGTITIPVSAYRALVLMAQLVLNQGSVSQPLPLKHKTKKPPNFTGQFYRQARVGDLLALHAL